MCVAHDYDLHDAFVNVFCRMFVWRSLLCLPENHAAYSSLTDKGLHSAYVTLHDKYPIKSQKLQRGLQRYPDTRILFDHVRT